MKKDIRLEKEQKGINRRGLSYVPGFQGRTGDVKNNKNIERLDFF